MSGDKWLEIQYRDFHDVPRIFLVEHGGVTFLFDCPFDESTDDYGTTYRVYKMPELAPLALQGSWSQLPRRAVAMVGEVLVSAVEFDPTRRSSIRALTLAEFLTDAAGPALTEEGQGGGG